MPVTPVARTLLDLAAVLPFALLRRAVAEADFRRRLDRTSIEALLKPGQPGSAALRRALDTHLPRLDATRSVLEQRFLCLCEEAQIPLPEVNAKLDGFVVDALWRDQRVIVELDGHAAHSTRAAIHRDRSRDLRLRAAGFLVNRYSWHQITREQDAVVADLRLTLARR